MLHGLETPIPLPWPFSQREREREDKRGEIRRFMQSPW